MTSHRLRRAGRRLLCGLALLTFLGLLIGPGILRAEEPDVVFVEDRAVLNGTPGATLRFPIDLQASLNGAKAVSLSIESLSNQDHPDQTILSDRVSFLPASFDMAPDSQRRVWGTINFLPSAPGVYRGDLVASYGIGPTLQTRIKVELTVEFAEVRMTPSGGTELKIQGQSEDLSEVVWLQAVDGPASGVTLASDKLSQVDGNEAILPDQVILSPASVNLSQGESAIVTIKVTGDVAPGKYQGQVRLRQANQSLNEVEPFDLAVEVLPTPTLSLPQGSSVTAELVRCGNWLDCLLARYLLPSDYQQQGLLLQVENTSPNRVNITNIQPTIARIGMVNVQGAVSTLELAPLPIAVEPRSSQDIELKAPTAKVDPGQYKGNVTLYLSDESGRTEPDKNQVISVDMKVRNGPLLAILLIVLGIAAGRFLQRLSSEQTRLLGLYYRLRGRMRPYEKELSEADKEQVEAHALALRNRIYDQDLEKLEEKLKAFGQRPQRLLSLDEALPAIQEACEEHGLDEADCHLLREAGEGVRTKIHSDEDVDVVAEVKAIAARAGALHRLRDLVDDVANSGLEEAEKGKLFETVRNAQAALGQGDEKTAQTGYENVRRALELLPEIRKVQDDANKSFQGKPTELAVIGLELNMAREAVFNFDFDQARHWLEWAWLTLASWQQPPPKAGQKMAGGRMPWGVGGDWLGETVVRLTGQMAGWWPLAFLGDRDRVSVEPSLPRPRPSLREWLAIRWHGFTTAAVAEIGLWIGTPLLWLITMVVTALIGFQALYVVQGTTFGASPINDYLTLILWGLTSDVAGATVSKLADFSKTGA